MLILSSCGEKTKKKNYDIEGNWLGELSIQGMPLKIAFNFKAEGDTYVVTLDSPDQGAFDTIKLKLRQILLTESLKGL